MRANSKPIVPPPLNRGLVAGAGGRESGAEWELRPGGMLVQKRNLDSDRRSVPPPTIRVIVKYGSAVHEININSQSTFGELKKILAGRTGLDHRDQKLMFKGKEKDSSCFLDVSGVKDKSKIVLIEDPICTERRYLEMRRITKIEKASKSISDISLEIDRLGDQATEFESIVNRGRRVAEKAVVDLTEALMNQLLKLDGVAADGDVKLQRKMQVRRVQKLVEALDVVKMKNSLLTDTALHQRKHPNESTVATPSSNMPVGQQNRGQLPLSRSSSGAVVVTTQWEVFDATSPTIPNAPRPPSSPNLTTNSRSSHKPEFPWDLLD